MKEIAKKILIINKLLLPNELIDIIKNYVFYNKMKLLPNLISNNIYYGKKKYNSIEAVFRQIVKMDIENRKKDDDED